MTLTLQEEFKAFHENIKIGNFDENETLRDKRDMLLDELKAALADELIPGTEKKLTFEKLDQGSYAMNTGILPIDDDYDIDVGVVFDLDEDEYDSHKLKELIYDKVNKHHNRTVLFNRPCITVKYAAGYHVDLVVYAKNNGQTKIAWGKKTRADDTGWVDAAPKELTDWVQSVSSSADERAQFRRCVKYLKKWKQKKFSSEGNAAPPSIGLTIQARNSFSHRVDDDFAVLINMAKHIQSKFTLSFDSEWNSYHLISERLPVKPKGDVYSKMTANHMQDFYEKICDFVEALEAAQEEESAHKASKILRKIFGDDFPLIEDSISTKASSRPKTQALV